MRPCEGIRKVSVPRASHEQSEQSREDRSRRGMKHKNIKTRGNRMATLLIKNIGTLQTPIGSFAHKGRQQGENRKLHQAAILAEDGIIKAITADGVLPCGEDEADTVIDQSLTPGSVVLKGTTISLTISSGSDGETSQKSTVADSQGAWYGSINTAVKIGGETSPAADTRRIILIRLCQEIDGAERYTTLQEARSYEAGTELQVVIPNIRGAAGIGKGTVEIVDASNDTVIASYTVNFAPRS